MMIVQ